MAPELSSTRCRRGHTGSRGLQRVASSASMPPCGIENGLCEKSTCRSPRRAHTSGNRRSRRIRTGPRRSAQLAPDLVAGLRRDGLKILRPPAQEERRIACAQAQLLADRLGPFGADVLGHRTRTDGRARPRRARRYSPSPAAPLSGQRRSCGRRTCGCRPPGAGIARISVPSCSRSFAKIEAGAAKCSLTHLHLDRVAQVRLVGAVAQHGVAIGDARPAFGHRPAAAEFLEHAAHHGFDRLEHILCSTKLISMSSW
jgi:hypothetical protein